MSALNIEVISSAKASPLEAIELSATDQNKSQHFTLNDACMCTGNCPEIC